MTTVTTIDGRQVDTESEAWRATCEAVRVLSMPQCDREAFLAKVAHHRGAAGRQALEQEMDRIEPAYLLAMGTVEQRRAYLTQAEHYRGDWVRKDLERRIVALWEQRKAAVVAAS